MRALTLIAMLALQGCGCGATGAEDGGRPDAGRSATGLPTGPWYCLFINCFDAGVPPRCSPMTCAGCCDARGLCQTGNIQVQCGNGGSACVTCDRGFFCEFGVCRPPEQQRCGPDTCVGCCAIDGRCLPGAEQFACGASGVGCMNCGPTSQCTGGRCGPRCDASNCSGCCAGDGLCWSGFADDACGRGGIACTTCSPSTACTSAGACMPKSCAGCVPGQCCLDGVCTAVGPQRCAATGVPNAACRLCAGPEACGDGTEVGFCVRPSARGLGEPCVWDGDCTAGGTGRPACLTGLSWPQGYCSERCDAGTCSQGVCQRWPTRDVCLRECAVPGASCPNPQTVCDVIDAGVTACVPKCNAGTAAILCASGRCHGDGRCCGTSGRACCDTGAACAGVARDGGVSACVDGSCS